MNTFDYEFKRIVSDILDYGFDTMDRTGVGTRKLFGQSYSVDLSTDDGKKLLPAMTLRKVYPRVVFEELFWMLSGSTDANILKEKGIHIWDGNTTREFLNKQGLHHLKEGSIGKGYGHQFRNSNGVDQLANVYDTLWNNPSDRRMVIDLWNPADLDEMALPPCHLMYQFVVTGRKLNLSFYQRSSDFILASNHNFMFAALFLHFMADLTGLEAGIVKHDIGDCHIYSNHLEVAEELLKVENRYGMATFEWKKPALRSDIDPAIVGMKWEDFKLNYESSPAIAKDRLEMAV